MRKGIKFTEEHKRKIGRRGEENKNWKGDNITLRTGGNRARHLYRCPLLSWLNLERHHINGNPKDNRPENIAFLSQKDHMEKDGRVDLIGERRLSFKYLVIRIMMYRLGLCDRAITQLQGLNNYNAIGYWRRLNNLFANSNLIKASFDTRSRRLNSDIEKWLEINRRIEL